MPGNQPAPGQDGERWRILLVDDDEDEYLLTRELLTRARPDGFELAWALTIEEAREALDAGGVDAALVDYSLGSMAGTDFIRERRQQGDSTPMILYTGWGTYAVDLEAMQAGAVDYLNKSEVSPAVLERSIRYAIERRRHLEALSAANAALERELDQRRQAEQAARSARESLGRSEQRFQGLFEAMIEGFALGEILFDEQGQPAAFRFLEVNPGFELNTGLSAGQLTGRPLGEALPNLEPYWLEVFSRVARFGQPLHFTAFLQDLNIWLETFTYRPEPGRFAVLARNISARVVAEQELRASEERFRAVLENSLDVAYRRNLQTDQYDYLSPVIEQVTGYSVAEMRAMSIQDVLDHIHPDDVTALEAGIEQSDRQGIARLEYRFLAKDGQYRWMADYFTVTCDETGRPLYRGGIMRDISASRQVEEALRASERRFRMALESIPDVVVLYDRDLRIQYINAATRSITGQDQEFFLGRRDVDVWPPEISSKWLPALEAALLSGETQAVDIEFPSADGGIRYLQIQCVPIKEPDGFVCEVLGITHDLTFERQAAEAVRTSEMRFRTALEHAPISVYTLDRDLRYTWMYNPPPGLTVEQMIGRSLDEIFLGADLGEVKAVMQNVLDSGAGVHTVITFNPDGESMTYDLTFEPIFAADRSVQGLTAAALDITEQSRLRQEQLEHHTKQEVQRRLLGHREQERTEIARLLHDTALQGLLAANLGVGAALSTPERAELDKQLSWVQELLRDLAQEMRRVVFELRPPMLSSYGLGKSIRAHLFNLQEWNSDVRVDLLIMGDEERIPPDTRLALYRIYQELVNNVVHHAQAQELDISLEITAEGVVLEVRDNGIGFDASADWIALADRGSFGLISIREQVQAAGGQVQFQSQPGRGSSARVSVPLDGGAGEAQG